MTRHLWLRSHAREEAHAPARHFAPTSSARHGEGTPGLTVAVRASHRQRGAGRALLRHLLAEAHGRGIERVSLSVEPDNQAVALYRSLGFRTVMTGDA